jgi:cytochrome c2
MNKVKHMMAVYGLPIVLGLSTLIQEQNDKKLSLIAIVSLSDTIITPSSKTQLARGKMLFQKSCQNCHALDKLLTGPPLRGFIKRGPWKDRKQLYAWIANPGKFVQTNKYAKELVKQFGVLKPAFPTLSPADIEAIVAFTNTK